MEKKITFRAVIEVIGKPKEHVEKAIKDYVDNLKKSEYYQVVDEEFADVKERDQDFWATFAELELKTKKPEHLVAFCFEFMPSILEIIEPKEFKLSNTDFSQFLNDLQARLHNVDMVTKSVKMENDILKKNTSYLLKNYIILLLRKSNLDANQLSQLTGVNKDKLEDFLDTLIDQDLVDLKEEVYFLKDKK